MSTEHAIEYWHYERSDGEVMGPVPRDDVLALLAQGTIDGQTLVWRAGLPGWQTAGHALLRTHWPRLPRLRTTALIVLTAVAITANVQLLFFSRHILDIGGPDEVSALWAAIVAGVICLSGVTVALWWHLATDLLKDRPSPMTGIIKAGAVVLATTFANLAIVGLINVPRLAEVVLARRGYDDYTIRFDSKSATLHVEGLVGPRFGARIAVALDEHPVRAIELTSTGGLIDEALRAAEAIEPRKLEVIVRKECASACLIVLAAGAKRYARWDATLAFHASASIVPGIGALGPDDPESRAADAYLLERGAPRTFVDEANRLGPDLLLPVDPNELVQHGFITRVFEKDPTQSARPELATLRNVETALAEGHWPAAETLRAIREATPELVARRAAELRPFTAPSDEVAVNAAYTLLDDLRRDALQAAADDTVAAYAQAKQRAVDALAMTESWEDCTAFLSDPVTSNTLTVETRLELVRALVAVIKSAEANAWKPKPEPTDAHTTYEALAAQADVASLGYGDPASNSRRCQRGLGIINAINGLAPGKAVETFRYADRYGALMR